MWVRLVHVPPSGFREKKRGRSFFDFPGERTEATQPGASDRRNFMEQFENAFRTAVRVAGAFEFEEERAFDDDVSRIMANVTSPCCRCQQHRLFAARFPFHF